MGWPPCAAFRRNPYLARLKLCEDLGVWEARGVQEGARLLHVLAAARVAQAHKVDLVNLMGTRGPWRTQKESVVIDMRAGKVNLVHLAGWRGPRMWGRVMGRLAQGRGRATRHNRRWCESEREHMFFTYMCRHTTNLPLPLPRKRTCDSDARHSLS